METGPGLSLFQGSDSIQLNTMTQGFEEDEEQEDKRRLNEEVTLLVFLDSSTFLFHWWKVFAFIELVVEKEILHYTL